jgi:MFS family permease
VTTGWSRPAAIVVAAALFLENFDGVVLVTAAPAIARDFGVAAAHVGVASTAYLLAVAVFIPVSGWAAERWGARRVFCAAIAVFVSASLLCSLSGGVIELVAGRVLQGIGGSMMVPVGRLIVLRETDKRELLRAVAFLTWPALVAPVVAPLAGGVLTQYLGWPWIFYLNLPLGLLLFAAALRFVPAVAPVVGRTLDLRGLAGVSVTLVSLVLGVEQLSSSAGAASAAVLLATALVAGAGTVRWLSRTRHPFLDLSAFRLPTFRVTNSSGVWFRASVSAVPFLLPLLGQEGFGWSPVLAGTMVMVLFVGNLAVKPVTSRLIGALGFAPVMIGSALGLAATLAACALLPADAPLWWVAAVFGLSGAFRSTGFTAYGTIQFADVGVAEMPAATTLSSTLVQLAAGLGVAVAALAVRFAPGAENTAEPYRWALVVVAVIAAASCVGAMRLPPGSADDVRRGGSRRG